MTQRVAEGDYKLELERQQGRLNVLHRKAQRRGISTILVFEGWDAAGKGGAIRADAAIDARACQVIPSAAPRKTSARTYLWRFWRHLAAAAASPSSSQLVRPPAVERARLRQPKPVDRAAAEINQFESQLVAHGIVW